MEKRRCTVKISQSHLIYLSVDMFCIQARVKLEHRASNEHPYLVLARNLAK